MYYAPLHPRELMEVTVYGMTKTSYEAVSRVSGSYDEFRRGIDLLLDRKIPFVVKSSFLPTNRDEIALFENWESTIPAMKVLPVYSLFLDLRCRRDSPAKNLVIESLRISPEEGLAILSQNRQVYSKHMQDFCSRFMRPPGERLFPCGAGLGGCVDAYGVLQPCLLLRHPETVYALLVLSMMHSPGSFLSCGRRRPQIPSIFPVAPAVS